MFNNLVVNSLKLSTLTTLLGSDAMASSSLMVDCPMPMAYIMMPFCLAARASLAVREGCADSPSVITNIIYNKYGNEEDIF